MVRIWCLPVKLLNRQHLLGEHHELHCIYNVITKNLKGFANHPQTNRFRHRLGMLVDQHLQQVVEMQRRGYNHRSPLDGGVEPEFYVYSDVEFIHDLLRIMSRKKE